MGSVQVSSVALAESLKVEGKRDGEEREDESVHIYSISRLKVLVGEGEKASLLASSVSIFVLTSAFPPLPPSFPSLLPPSSLPPFPNLLGLPSIGKKLGRAEGDGVLVGELVGLVFVRVSPVLVKRIRVPLLSRQL